MDFWYLAWYLEEIPKITKPLKNTNKMRVNINISLSSGGFGCTPSYYLQECVYGLLSTIHVNHNIKFLTCQLKIQNFIFFLICTNIIDNNLFKR